MDVGDDGAGVSNPSAACYPSFTQMEQIHCFRRELLQAVSFYSKGVVTLSGAINYV